MNGKRFALGCAAVYVVHQVLGFLIHQVVLGEIYGVLVSVWRPEAQMMSLMWIQFITSAVWVVLFCYIFTRGHQNRGVREGRAVWAVDRPILRHSLFV